MVLVTESDSGVGPAVLQLRKWGPSFLHSDISEYHEALLSPTRELLLLISHQSEALLLPLNAGDVLTSSKVEKDDFDKFQLEESRRLSSLCGSTSTSAPSSVFSCEPTFIAGVKSLAWAYSGDTYDLYKNFYVKELLILSADRGVTIHCFRSLDNSQVTSAAQEENTSWRGRWVDWGPADASIHTQVEEHSSGRKNASGLSSGSSSTSKKWLCSFVTEVETIETNGDFVTKFPPKCSFPGDAEVVSFFISFTDRVFLDFLSRANLNEKENQNHQTRMDPLLTCSRVFSSSSHHMVGFVLVSPEPVSIDTSMMKTQCPEEIIVAIAILYRWGFQWVCSVQLRYFCPKIEWVDFNFSDKLLVCLGSTGLISFWDARNGQFIAQLNVSHCCGLSMKQQLIVDQSNLGVVADVTHRNENCGHNRIFKRIMVAFNSSMLGIVDEYGIVYVICADDYVSEKHYSFNKLVPHFLHCGLGIMSSWEAAGSEIGDQRVLSDLSNYKGLTENGSSCTVHKDDLKLWKKQKWLVQGKASPSPQDSKLSSFSNPSQGKVCNVAMSVRSSTPIRRIFLPYSAGEEGSICFSPLGVTRLFSRCKEKDNEGLRIVHTSLRIATVIYDDRDLDGCLQSRSYRLLDEEHAYAGKVVGCSFQGCLYLVAQYGIFVVLPSVSITSDVVPVDSIGGWLPGVSMHAGHLRKNVSSMEESKMYSQPWKIEVLDKVLLHEGPMEADRLCLLNDWDLKIVRMRRLQLAMHYMRLEEIEESLESLVDVNLAEEGVFRLLFSAIYQTFSKVGSDNEVALASRLLALATCFATKMVRKYGMLQQKHNIMLQAVGGSEILYLESVPSRGTNGTDYSSRLQEMAHFLEIIRNLQRRLSTKCRRPQGVVVDNTDEIVLLDTNSLQDDSSLPGARDASEAQSQRSMGFSSSESECASTDKLALSNVDSVVAPSPSDLGSSHTIAAHECGGDRIQLRKVLPLENPKDMFSRWKVGNLDLKTVVKDALQSDRLPLAVLQLHLQRSKDLASEKDYHDSFNEVRDVGRAIAYNLFLKGETELAVTTLQRLGEDIEVSLFQLVFGTVRRSLRVEIAEKMKTWGYLGPSELNALERLSLIERVYPSSTFWGTYGSRQQQRNKESSYAPIQESKKLQFTCSWACDAIIECGEIDGVVLGSWPNLDEGHSFQAPEGDQVDAGYWAAAAIWSDVWEQITVDRIVLDQPFLMGVHVEWKSQFEYYVCHNDWDEVLKLLNMVPATVLSDGNLQISLAGLDSSAASGQDYFCRNEELDFACIIVPNVKLFTLSLDRVCSLWLKTLIEQELAKNFIFIKGYWEGTEEIVALLARAGFITGSYHVTDYSESWGKKTDLHFPRSSASSCKETMQALHRLVINHCSRYNLPSFLDLYLDHHEVVLDNDSLDLLLEAAGDCEWAWWLLLSRIKGREYDASFANTRSIISRNIVPGSKLSVPELEDIICTVDDIAEGGGEMAALATLVYAPNPIQKCLCSGSVNRHCSSSEQCTLENLRPCLQHFPTLWRALVGACFGHDPSESSLGFTTKNAFGKSIFSGYLLWRESVFSSCGSDTSLIQMLPCWFPKSVRRLVQIFVQSPLGWQSLTGGGESFSRSDIYLDFAGDENTDFSAISWEATIQKNIEKELYASSLEANGFGIEHHLHRGRPLAAFSNVLAARTQKLKPTYSLQTPHGPTMQGQASVQSDVQRLLVPLTEDEESLLSSVMPLAILHFEEPLLVSSCAFLLELCGLSSNKLCVDVAALSRISAYYKSIENMEQYSHVTARSSAFHPVSHEGDIAASLARALADDYLHPVNLQTGKKDTSPKVEVVQRPSQAFCSVLQHLEKASLPSLPEGKTCGSWLLSGDGDGTDLRSQQKAASEHWSLVTSFCQIHQLSLSTKYLSVLAKDNDWVGFLTEAQGAGFPFDVVVQVASEEFSDPRLKMHILNVLRNMQSARRKAGSASSSLSMGSHDISLAGENYFMSPTELFGLLADCEKQKNPGETLLMRARDLRWSLLAMVASCFPDASPLACLTVWLEITAARETSSIKVNDIFSKIAQNTGAAVEATNQVPASERVIAFRYNRRNPKRRRLMEPTSTNSSDALLFKISATSSVTGISAAQEIADEESRKKDPGQLKIINNPDETLAYLSKMVAVLCEQHLFLPLLRAFEMFLPSCSLLPFIRFLQAFSQMRLTDAANHLNHFSGIFRDERPHMHSNLPRDCQISSPWIGSTAVKAAEAILSTCPSPYEKRCLLHLLSSADFGDGGSAAARFRQFYWKINIAEPSLRKDDGLHLGKEILDDDASLLTALEKNGDWEQARSWARQLEANDGQWKNVVHHVTETQAEAMVVEWKEFLWDVPEERAALWGHCQTLFIRHHFPALEAGLFFLRHAETVEKDIPARELHEMLLLALQWLSGSINQINPVYPLHLLREIETRVWLLAVESEAQAKTEGDFTVPAHTPSVIDGNTANIIEQTASVIGKMDNHLNLTRVQATERGDSSNGTLIRHSPGLDANSPSSGVSSTKPKRRTKGYPTSRRSLPDAEKISEQDNMSASSLCFRNNNELFRNQEENVQVEASVSGWEERVGPAEIERAVLSLLEFGQIAAAKQLQHKLSPTHVPSEFLLVDVALKLACTLSPSKTGEISLSMLDLEVCSVLKSHGILNEHQMSEPLQVLDAIAIKCTEGCGRGLCKRIIAVVKAANMLGLSFSEAFEKRPIELLQLLSLKAQESFEEAKILVETHFMTPASIAQILAESFLKGLLAAHRGGYIDSQKEEGPAPLLWRFSDFLKWAELCPSEPEIGHALMRLVITGQEIPHACEVELLILSHHFYKSSACLDGVDVLVALAATRIESYVSEGDFSCLARLVTGVSNFHALDFIIGILIENGQLELLLHKYSAADRSPGSAEEVRGFRMAVLASLKHFNPHDHDALALVYNHFDMKHEMASLLEMRATESTKQWFLYYDRELNEDLLDSMRYYIEAAEVHSTIDAGNKAKRACAQASVLSLQICIPDFDWLHLSETNARRVLVEQSRFQEALIVAEAYGLNQPSEWALVLWNQMLKPDLIEQFIAEFVAVLPLQSSMLAELARFYRAEVAARGDQSHFSVWLSPGGLPAEWMRHLGKSFRSLLKRTRDLRLRVQLATIATGFGDVIDACMKDLDKVPETAGPLVLRKGHGGTYLPLM
ncbi:hypothetical protein H6P81_001364 [Aristolochia fimbriata]|uniref:Spatacsin C-terminal domain-containing protein n=1 Tax=Aristolochia fimbriata TaxID=158543 RepID=A0AAV7FAJ6_ARIFI|nr:hypothetical protein H6P81_001364 [Aristolochia fimbriata]